MIRGFLANIAFGSVKTQLMIGATVVVPLVIFGLVKMWQYDIEEKTRADIKGELQSATIEAQKKARKADEKVFNADDDLLCAILGGCGVSGEENNGGGN